MSNNELKVEDIKDLVIEEDKIPGLFEGMDPENIEVKSSDALDNFDFSSDEEFDIETNYEYVEHLLGEHDVKKTKELMEKEEADNIIKETSFMFLDEKYVTDVNKQYNNVISLMRKYKYGTDLVNNMTEEDKDKIYRIAQYLFTEFQKNLNRMTFKFDITGEEFEFLFDVIRNKLEYDQNKVFQVLEVYEKYLKVVDDNLPRNAKRTVEPIQTNISVNDMIMMYHIISEYKVKGINKSFYHFKSILSKIGDRVKLFNAYNVWNKRLSDDILLWAGTLTPEIQEEVTDEGQKIE